MRLFNAVQVTVLFAVFPFLVAWVGQQEFRGSTAVLYATGAAYVVSFGCMVASVYTALDTLDKNYK